ncbi:hypothetical protein QQF64_025349 [Cirrhinus molitorella]|uniref:Uncharacterized protein n=1 Tax=Cirrhinus molitorella TaxID=172907 RepID=A0ABR3NPV5_9TELE
MAKAPDPGRSRSTRDTRGPLREGLQTCPLAVSAPWRVGYHLRPNHGQHPIGCLHELRVLLLSSSLGCHGDDVILHHTFSPVTEFRGGR